MKFTIRFAMMLAVVAMIAAFAPKTVQAQAPGAFGLSDTDAALLKDAATNLKTLKSFTMDYTFDFSGTGLSMAPNAKDPAISVQGSGPFAFDMTKAQGATAADYSAAVGALTMQQTITASASGGTSPDMKGAFEFRIVDGVLYFEGDTATKGKWMKVNLADAIKMGQKSNPLAGGASGNNSKMQAQLLAAFSDPEVSKALPKLLATPGFIVFSDGEPMTIDGVKATNIVLTIDLTKAIASPDIKPIVKALLKLQASQSGSTAATVTDDQVDQVVTLGSTLLKKGTITVNWLVGEDKNFRGFGFSVDAAVDTSMFNAQAKGPSTVKLNFLVKLSKLNEDVKVDPVADAQDVPLNGTGSMMATPAATAAQ
jgi:hypothetical protein